VNQRALWADPNVRLERQARAEAFMGRSMEFDEETTMTRVTDDELDRMTAMCASDVTDDRRSLLGDAVRAELLALRKVADAAVDCREHEFALAPSIKAALREAGL